MKKVLLVLLSFFVFGCVDLHAYSSQSVHSFKSGQKVLDGGDFTNYTFTLPNFSHKQLINANFSNAVLNGATFSGAKLDNANFSHANMLRGNYGVTVFNGADCASCDFSYSKCSQGEFTGGIFNNSKFNHASFTEGISAWKSQFKNCNFDNAVLQGIDFSRSNLTGSTFKNAVFGSFDYSNTSFAYANLTNTNFTKANISGASFGKTILTGADFTKANLSSVTFSYYMITSFHSTTLAEVNFTGANLSGANFHYTTIGSKSNSPSAVANFTNANLTNANFSGLKSKEILNANFTNANFSGANLSGVTFGKNVILNGADFTNSTFNNSIFECSLKGVKGLVFALIKNKQSKTLKDILNAGYVITSAEMKNIGSHFSKHADLYKLAQEIKTLTSAYKEDEKEIQKYMKSGNQQWMTVSKRAATTYSQLEEARKQHAVLLSQVAKNDKSGQGVLTDYINGLGQKLLNLIAKSDSATAVKIANQVGQIPSVQLFKNFNLTEQEQPLTYVSSTNNMSPILMAAKMNLPTVMKALVKGLQGALGKPGAATYINSMNQSSTSSSGETSLIMLVINNIHTGDERDAGQVAQALIDGGLNLSALPGFMTNALKGAGVKGLK